MMNIQNAISKISVLKAVQQTSIASFCSCGVLKKYRKGEHLFFDKDEVRHVYFLVEGTVSMYRLNHLYKKVIFIYGSGSMLNEVIIDNKPASINCEFLSDALIMSLSISQFLKICEQDFYLSKAVMDSMALKIRRLYHQMINTANTVRGDKRIAAKLWKLSKDHGIPYGGHTKINFELSITFLAELVGSTRETVSRQVKLLIERNLVYIEKNHFYISDREKLLEYFNQS